MHAEQGFGQEGGKLAGKRSAPSVVGLVGDIHPEVEGSGGVVACAWVLRQLQVELLEPVVQVVCAAVVLLGRFLQQGSRTLVLPQA